jgi:hypothetical protein
MQLYLYAGQRSICLALLCRQQCALRLCLLAELVHCGSSLSKPVKATL